MDKKLIDYMKEHDIMYADTDCIYVNKNRNYLSDEEKEYIKHDIYSTYAATKTVRTDLMEAIDILCKNISSDVQTSVHGKAHAHYNRFTDVLEVTISNRVLNIEPFRYLYYNLSRDIKNRISSDVISRFVVKEYHDYVDMYIFKRY